MVQIGANMEEEGLTSMSHETSPTMTSLFLGSERRFYEVIGLIERVPIVDWQFGH